MILLYILLGTLCIAGTMMTALGTYTFIKIFIMPKTPPADRTNRINHLRIWFFALDTPEKFIAFYPWLARDERFNLRDEDKR